MKQRYYVGKLHKPFCTDSVPRDYYQVFQSEVEPIEETHGRQYKYAVGPFRTKAGAEYMRDCGFNNPHCLTVADAEYLAKEALRQYITGR